MTGTMVHPSRASARNRVERRRRYPLGGLVAYIVVISFLVALWAMTGAGYFWPAYVIAGWGVLDAARALGTLHTRSGHRR
jgi:hypothetical protein